jgi:hypothetical protein
VDGDHISRADELVELDVVDMATRAELRSVQHDENVVPVGAHLGHSVALHAGTDGQGVEAEHLRQHPGGLLVTDGDIDPYESVVAVEQLLQLPDRMLLDAFIGHEANVRPDETDQRAGSWLPSWPSPGASPACTEPPSA